MDWLSVLSDLGDFARKMTEEIPMTLSDPSITADQTARLYQVLEKQVQTVEQMVGTMHDEDVEENLIEAAETLEEIFSDLAAAAANKLIELRQQ
jgi:phage-related protein